MSITKLSYKSRRVERYTMIRNKKTHDHTKATIEPACSKNDRVRAITQEAQRSTGPSSAKLIMAYAGSRPLQATQDHRPSQAPGSKGHPLLPAALQMR